MDLSFFLTQSFWIKTLELILALSILVVFHELGHYSFARLFGVWVEKFYMFFNYKFSLVKWKPGKYLKWFSHGSVFESCYMHGNSIHIAFNNDELLGLFLPCKVHRIKMVPLVVNE